MPKITTEDLKKSVTLATERVRKRLEVLEPHIFANGMSIMLSNELNFNKLIVYTIVES